MHILLAGFGNMGTALVCGWRDSTALDAEITVVDPDARARERAAAMGLRACSPEDPMTESIDVAVLAVKPLEIEAALAGLPSPRLVVSIAAGRTIAEIEAIAGAGTAIVRAMPNTPAAIGLGVTGLCANERVSPGDRELASLLMEAVGTVEWLDDESDMDAVTAVSGSGPAYVFLLIECLTAAAVDVGLEPAMAERLATATVAGAGAFASRSEVDAATLRRRVTSPQGTTAAALEVLLDDAPFESLIRRAVRAAANRSRELGSSRKA